MKNLYRVLTSSFAAAVLIAIPALSTWAQTTRPSASVETPTFCPEGRLTSGACINPGLASVARKRAIVMTQQKFSYSTRLVLPAVERAFPVPFDYREYQRGVFSTNYYPYSCHPNC